MFGDFFTLILLKHFAFPVIQSIFASAIFEYLKDECELPSARCLTFDESVKEALCRAVKEYKKINRQDTEHYTESEFRFYFKVLKDDLLNLEPAERKKYIDHNLYKVFVKEVKKSPDAMKHLTFELMRDCKLSQHNTELLVNELFATSKKTLWNTEQILSNQDTILAKLLEIDSNTKHRTYDENETVSSLLVIVKDSISSLIEELKIESASTILNTIESSFANVVCKNNHLKAEILYQEAKIEAVRCSSKYLKKLDEAHILVPDDTRFDKDSFNVLGNNFDENETYHQPEYLCFSNLNDWFCCLSKCRLNTGNFIILSKEAPQSISFEQPYQTAKHFVEFLEQTEAKDCFSIAKCLYHYWAYIITLDDKHVEEYLSINRDSFGKQSILFNYYKLSLLLLSGRNTEALDYLYSLDISDDRQLLTIELMISIQLRNENIVEWAVSAVNNNKWTFDLEETVLLCHAIDSVKITNSIIKILETSSFYSEEAKSITIEYMRLLLGETVNLETAGSTSNDLPDDLLVCKAIILCRNSRIEDAYNIIKSVIKDESNPFQYRSYIEILGSDDRYASELYEALKTYRHKGFPYEYKLWWNEYVMACNLADDTNAMEVINDLFKRKPDDNEIFCHYISKVGASEPDKLQKWESEIFEKKFNNRQAVSVCETYASNGYLNTAAELLYRYTNRSEDFGIKNYYHLQVTCGYLKTVADQEYNTAEEGLYALCDVKGKRSFYILDKESPIGSKLIGKNVGDKLNAEISIGSPENIEIIAIHNKYYKLAADILIESNNGNNPGLRPLTVDMNNPLESLKEKLATLNPGGKSIEEKEKTIQKDYTEGKIGLCQMIDHSNPIPSYYKLLFSHSDIYVHNTIVALNLLGTLPSDIKYILDLPSVITFAEFTAYSGLNIQGDKHITSNLKKLIEETHKKQNLLQLSDLFQALRFGELKHFDKQMDIDAAQHLSYLSNWAKDNCDVEIATQTLAIKSASQKQGSWFISTLSMLVDSSYVIVTDDIHISKLLPGYKMISTETYVALNCDEAVLKAYSRFLLKNNFLGTLIDTAFIVEEFAKKASGSDNYMETIINAMMYNPLQITNAITAIVQLYQSDNNKPLLAETARNIFVSALKGFTPEYRNTITDLVDKYNALPSFRFVKERMEEALELIDN